MRTLDLRETIKHLKSKLIGSTLKEENQVLKQKVNLLDLKFKETLEKWILELEKQSNVAISNSRILELEEKIKILETEKGKVYEDILDLEGQVNNLNERNKGLNLIYPN